MRHPAAMGVLGHVAARTLVLIAAVIAALVFSTVLNLTATARGAGPMKAVIIVGPNGANTANNLRYGETIADEAESHGMIVARVFHPQATWKRVKQETTGAHLIIYLGHGFGWPSPYPAHLFESQMDGFGINFPDPDRRGDYDTHYYGGDRIRESLRFAPNAVVILNHACYTSGFGEPGQANPSQSVAIQRVDNFAAAFLQVGAGVVFALEYQPPETLVGWLNKKHETMDELFRRRFNPWTSDSYGGWVGWNPTYHPSVRNPGATILLDPHRTQGYRRAITGNLGMTTDEWKGPSDPDDVIAPEVTSLVSVPSAGTVPVGEDEPPVFTPNNDGLSDDLNLDYEVSEATYLDVEIRDSSDSAVRHLTLWTGASGGSTSWNGKDDQNDPVPNGRYDIHVTPRDAAGNVGPTVSTRAKVMRTMKAPAGSPSFFFARDGDALAASSELSVNIMQDASLDWRILDSQGELVRTVMPEGPVTPGLLTQTWDGRDDAGEYVPDGVYRQIFTATTEQGTYSHRVDLRVMPFKVTAPRWSGPAGTQVRFTMTSAEALSGWPVVEIYQPGLSKYRASPIRYSATKFKFSVTFRSGGSPGEVRIKMTGTDTGGGSQTGNAYFTLE